jgi:hypothetical protein
MQVDLCASMDACICSIVLLSPRANRGSELSRSPTIDIRLHVSLTSQNMPVSSPGSAPEMNFPVWDHIGRSGPVHVSLERTRV